jgi:lipopolysaccharide/colanic/teichoic acid biosynthesis glycosyltransferase
VPSDQTWRRYSVALMATDSALLVLAFVLAALLRDAVDLLPYQPDFDPSRYSLVAVGLIPVFLGVFWLRGAYARRNLLGGPEEYARVFSGCAYGTLLVVAASYVYGSGPLVSRSWLLLFWLLSVVLVVAGRFTLRRIAYGLRRRGWFVRRVLIAGASDQGLAIAQQLHVPEGQGIEVLGFLDDYLSTGTRVPGWPADRRRQSPGFLVIGHPRHARALARRYRCDLLIAVPAALSWESQQSIAQLGDAAAGGLEVRLAPTLYDLTAVGVEAAPLGYIPLLRLQPARITGVDAGLRTVVDCGLAALLLAIGAPALGWAAAAARRRGIRPVLVHSRVLGQGGRPVTLSLLNPRISDRLLLRGLPALCGVVRGRVALVGPRPVMVDEQDVYRRWLGLLMTVRPGLTGPWRLADPAASPEERVLADVWWVRNWSLWQHLFVLLQTARRSLGPVHKGGELARWEADGADAGRADRALAS